MKKADEARQREWRRLRGARLLKRGVAQAEVARRLQVSRATVHAWNQRFKAGGLEALKGARRGRPPRLGPAQHAKLAEALKRGARAAGYATERWTLPRIGRLIDSLFGISYSDSQVSRHRIERPQESRDSAIELSRADSLEVPQEFLDASYAAAHRSLQRCAGRRYHSARTGRGRVGGLSARGQTVRTGIDQLPQQDPAGLSRLDRRHEVMRPRPNVPGR